jgi:hypothetical protein
MVQDGIFTFNVYRHHEKPWVEQLMVPYLVFFAVACVVSLFTLGQKGKLLVDKFRQRQAASGNAVENVETLEEKLIANKMEIRKIYCLLLLGATEGARCACATFAMRFARRSLVAICRCTRWPLCCRSADVGTLALLPGSICRRVHPFGRCPSQAFE